MPMWLSLVHFLYILQVLNLESLSGFGGLSGKIHAFFSRKRVHGCHGIFKETQDSKIIKNILFCLAKSRYLTFVCQIELRISDG